MALVTEKTETTKAEETNKADSSKAEKNRRILVIDDNEVIHDDFKAILGCEEEGLVDVEEEEEAIFGTPSDSLEKEVYEIDSAFQGQEGLEKVRQALKDGHPYAMAFVDVRMPPGWDGIETIKHIWEEYPALQVVICTAYSDYSWHDMLSQLGTTDKLLILKKPFDNMEVRQITCSLTEKWELVNSLERRVALRTEELQEVVNKLDEANSDLKDFVYIASHDLREPLRKISSFGELLEESLKGKLSDDELENLRFMTDGANRMTKMIEALLIYAKVSKNKPVFEIVDLNETVKKVEQLEVATLLEDTGGSIGVSKAMPKVWTDPVQLSQLLQNMIANGIKYQDKKNKPRIVITADKIDNDKVKISVKDNGIGIKKEYYGDVFKMFRRLHSCSEYEGTGIGLAVCKKIVDRLNGEIGVDSKVGQGSTFWVTLEAAREE
ncbi:MAG: response regulator [Planctomycetes bacterium]|nr:response regulator [Planctomycetota bacterium]